MKIFQVINLEDNDSFVITYLIKFLYCKLELLD